MTSKNLLRVALLCVIILFAAACGPSGPPSADQLAAQATASMAADADRMVGGQPAISNFTEKRNVKYLYELRDQDGLVTFTYITDLNGQLHHVCDSIGYGIPASMQYSNPQRIAKQRLASVTTGTSHSVWQGLLPQPEPNALFMPEGLSATYVLCVDPEGGAPRPFYVEDAILVSPFPLRAIDSYQLPVFGDLATTPTNR